MNWNHETVCLPWWVFVHLEFCFTACLSMTTVSVLEIVKMGIFKNCVVDRSRRTYYETFQKCLPWWFVVHLGFCHAPSSSMTTVLALCIVKMLAVIHFLTKAIGGGTKGHLSFKVKCFSQKKIKHEITRIPHIKKEILYHKGQYKRGFKFCLLYYYLSCTLSFQLSFHTRSNLNGTSNLGTGNKL